MSIEKVKKHQSKSGKKFANMLKEDETIRTLPNQIRYWTNKGYSKEEAKQKVSERNTTFSKEICIEKYGEVEGLKRWKNRQEKWQKTLGDKTQEEIDDINKRKAITKERMIEKWGEKKGEEKYKNWIVSITNVNNFASKEANNIFEKLEKHLLEKTKIDIDDIYYQGKNKEYFLLDEETNIFFYDFTIRSKKIIIEYHGEKYHPNKKLLSEKEWKNWKQLHSNKCADIVYERDKYKKKLAEENGFKIIEIFSQNKNPLKEMKKFIMENI